MSTTLKQVDIEAYKDRDAIRKFTVTLDGTAVNLTDGVINFKYIAEDGDPSEIVVAGVVGGANNNEVTFTIPKISLSIVGLYEYKVIQIPTSGEDIPWFYGNLTIVNEDGITASLEIYIQDEKPANLYISSDKKNNRVRYWRYYLQNLISPGILTEDLDNESKWPFLVNVLMAKLVVYDCLMLELKNSAATSAGSTGDSVDPSTGAGPVKKIETGPTNAEWYDSSAALANLLKANTNGVTAMDALKEDLCQLSHRLRIILPICKQLPNIPFIPLKAVQIKDSSIINELESINDIVSRG